MTSSFSTLRERLAFAQKEFGLTAAQLAKELRITPEWLSKIANDRAVGSPDIGLRLEAFIRAKGIEPASFFSADSVQSDYRKSGSSVAGAGGAGAASTSRMVQPGFQPPRAVPTRTDVEAYLKEYLDLAERVPGAVQNAYFEITEALSLEKIRRRAEQEA